MHCMNSMGVTTFNVAGSKRFLGLRIYERILHGLWDNGQPLTPT
jgi:hypothetical protein